MFAAQLRRIPSICGPLNHGTDRLDNALPSLLPIGENLTAKTYYRRLYHRQLSYRQGLNILTTKELWESSRECWLFNLLSRKKSSPQPAFALFAPRLSLCSHDLLLIAVIP